MADIQHKDVPESHMHDVKGATVSTEGQILKSTGGASAWVDAPNIGPIDYNDSTTNITPIPLTPNTWTDVPNNGGGAFTNLTYAPTDVTSLLDTTTGYLDFSQLELGDSVIIRIDFKVTPNVNNAGLECRYVLGDGAGEYALSVFEKRLDRGSGIPYDSDKGSFLIYMGDTNTRDNPGKLQVKLSSTGSLTNAGLAILLVGKI